MKYFIHIADAAMIAEIVFSRLLEEIPSTQVYNLSILTP